MLHILLVDDNPADAQVLEMALRKTGLPVDLLRLSDGEEAVRLLTSEGPHEFDVVLLDLSLPKLSGFEVLTRVRAHERLRGLPIVVMSGSTDAQDVARCYRAGANSYICKHTHLQKILDSAAHFAVYWSQCVELPSRASATPHACA